MTLQRTTSPATQSAPSRYVTDALDISLIGEETYCLLGSGAAIGFVQKRGNTFVGLLGEDILKAAPVGESLSFDATVSMVVDSYGR
ncbi:MAG: hypothetical protein ACKVOG_11765 [Rhodoglobus sp.]